MSERTHYEAVADIHYAIRLQELHERLFRRIGALLTLVAVVATSSAAAGFVAALAQRMPDAAPMMILGAGAALSILGAVGIVGDPSGKAWQHSFQRKRYCALAAKASRLKLPQLDAELHTISADDPPDIEALRVPAFNDTQRTLGHEDAVRPLGALQWVLAQLA